MWPFKKKQSIASIQLPPLKLPSVEEEKIILTQEHAVPDEIPALQSKPVINIPSKQEDTEFVFADETTVPEKSQQTTPRMMSQPSVPQRPMMKMDANHAFINTTMHNTIMMSLNEALEQLDLADIDLQRATNMLEARYDKVNSLQGTLEDVSKKLIETERMIFGG